MDKVFLTDTTGQIAFVNKNGRYYYENDKIGPIKNNYNKPF